MIRIIQKKTILPLVFAVVAVIAVSFLFSSCSKEETYRLVKINSYDGEVSVQREEKLNAFEGLQLVSNDTVSVGDKSFLELLADSDKHIAAEENTGFVLHSTGDENNGDITIDLLYGRSLFTIDNKLNEGSTFAVKTPNATLSVRGTSFSVAYDEETKTTNVEVYSGTVQLNSGDEEMLIEKDGTATIISTDEGIKIIANSTAGNPNAIAVLENTEKLFEIAMKYPQQEGYSAINAEYKAKASDYTVKETGIGDNDIVFQKFIGLIKNHNSEISKFFEENKANAVANTNKQQDVTDWFKEKITVGDKEFRIDKAIMDMSIYGSNLEKKYVTSDTYKVNTEGIDMYFCANGVEISFYGGFEKAEVVTTTTATTTTTVPETTVPETTTVETTTTTAATTVAPVTTTKVTTTAIEKFSGAFYFRRIPLTRENDEILYDTSSTTFGKRIGLPSNPLNEEASRNIALYCIYSDDGSYEIVDNWRRNSEGDDGGCDFVLLRRIINYMEKHRKELDKHIKEVYASGGMETNGTVEWFPKELTVKSDKGTYVMKVTGIRESIPDENIVTNGTIYYNIYVDVEKTE